MREIERQHTKCYNFQNRRHRRIRYQNLYRRRRLTVVDYKKVVETIFEG